MIVVVKGVYAFLEIVTGIIAFFVTKTFIVSVVAFLSHGELLEDPRDFFANYFMTIINNFSIHTKYLLAFYLLTHGVIKLLLVVGLLRRKLLAYPVSIVVFSLFIIYEIYRYFHTFSIPLLLLTILDVVIISLTIHEYRYIKSHNVFS